MDWKKLIWRFRQLGGIRLLLEYLRLGLGRTVFKQAWLFLTRRCSRDVAYARIRNEVDKKLQAKYYAYIKQRKSFYEDAHEPEGTRTGRKVWTCWLQGFDKAPAIVQSCQLSVSQFVTDRDIVQLTYDNYRDYVSLPEHVVEKYERGLIPPALFADILRLGVLIEKGGTWMDATILVTGQGPWLQEILDADLFMFQTLRRGDDRFHGISNWFISARRWSRPLMVLRDVLVEYWRDYSVTLDYCMFHDFFYAIAELYPEDIASMPKRNRLGPLMLMGRQGYVASEKGIQMKNAEWVNELLKHVHVHKLCWR